MLDKNKKLASTWFRQAKNDYKSAKVVLTEGGYYGTTCFLSQQIAEKYLKGFLVLNGIDFSRIHDLIKLLNDCKEIEKDFSFLEENCIILNEYYIESRYPMDEPIDYSKNEAKEALEHAEVVVDFVTKLIGE